MPGTIVSNDNFLEQSPKDLPHAVYGLRVHKCSFPAKLWEQVGGTFDRPGHQLWEKAHKSGKGDKVSDGFYFASININGVAHRLKCIKTDANREHDI